MSFSIFYGRNYDLWKIKMMTLFSSLKSFGTLLWRDLTSRKISHSKRSTTKGVKCERAKGY